MPYSPPIFPVFGDMWYVGGGGGVADLKGLAWAWVWWAVQWRKSIPLQVFCRRRQSFHECSATTFVLGECTLFCFSKFVEASMSASNCIIQLRFKFSLFVQRQLQVIAGCTQSCSMMNEQV